MEHWTREPTIGGHVWKKKGSALLDIEISCIRGDWSFCYRQIADNQWQYTLFNSGSLSVMGLDRCLVELGKVLAEVGEQEFDCAEARQFMNPILDQVTSNTLLVDHVPANAFAV